MPELKQLPGVLVVDDEPNNVCILELFLEDEGFTVFTACDGVQGWEKLHQHRKEINLILLDRMMPNMNGMEFMEKLKADELLSQIPVIMQTASAEKDQVAKGISAGVYYYLTKPYQENVMLSIVRAAISDYADYSRLRKELQEHKSRINLVKDCYFEVSTMGEIQHLSTFLANVYPDPERVVLGISELLLNAYEHGNLGISYAEKSSLLRENTWQQELLWRQGIPEHINKKVLVHFKRESKCITLNIKDEGQGFNWKSYLDIDADRATHSHGRGIALAKMMSFDSLEYKGCGNEVVCTNLL